MRYNVYRLAITTFVISGINTCWPTNQPASQTAAFVFSFCEFFESRTRQESHTIHIRQTKQKEKNK